MLFFILSIGGLIAILMNTFFTGGTGAARTGQYPSGYTQPFNFGGAGTVNAPVQGTGGSQAQAQDPGFFRRIWNSLGF